MAAGPHDPDEPGEKSARRPDARSQPSDTGPDGAEPSGSPDPGHDPPAGDPSDPEDIDARWRRIVADLGDLDGLGTSVADEPRPSEAGPAGARDGGDDLPDPAVVPDPDQGVPAALTGPRSWRPDPALEDAEDHFVPPDPGPVLGGDPLLTMAWVAAVGVPVLLIVAGVVWRDVPTLWLTGAGAVFLTGVGLLLWRMPHGDDDDPDDDPGAVV